MKTFVVNRKQDVERREKITAQLDALGVEFEIVEAVDGRALSDEAKRRLADYAKMRRVLRVLSDGEIGCAASHLRIYGKMADEGIGEAMVFEDDARILAKCRAVLDGAGGLGETPRVRLLTNRKRGMLLTVGYIINLAGARAMLKYNTPIWRVADCWESLARRKLLRVDWSESPLAEPDERAESVITPSGTPPHKIGLPNDLASVLRREFWRLWYGIGLRV